MTRLSAVFLFSLIGIALTRAQTPGEAGIVSAMKSATRYFHGSVARHGGYVYYYSPDLSRRLGEGVAGIDQIWVQPPANTR